MKSIKLILFLVVVLSFPKNGSSQLWKLYSDSAKIFGNLSNTGKAIEYNLKARDELQKDSAETRSFARICNELANTYVNAGRYEKAEPLYLESKQLREKILGKEHPDYALSCHDIAGFYRITGKYVKAEPLFQEAKMVREKILGKEHPDYASTCSALGILFHVMGQFQKAERLYIEAKQIREKVLGKEHLDFAISCSGLGNLYLDLGQYEKAESFQAEAKKIREKALGKDHPDYAASCNNLGNIYKRLGRYEIAAALYLEAKQIFEKIQHPFYASACENLGLVYLALGQYEKAEPLITETKLIREKVLGKEHPHYANSCTRLADLYCRMGKFDKAEALTIEAKLISEKVIGKDHPDYAAICHNLADIYWRVGRYEKAEALYLEAMQIKAKVLGKQHSDYAVSSNGLGILYSFMGLYDKAELLYLESMQIKEKAVGRDHPDYASSCDNLGNLYKITGQYEKAEYFFKESLKIKEKLQGKETASYAINANNLGLLYIDMGQFEKAELLCLQALKIFEKTTGKEEPNYAPCCENLGILYMYIAQYEKAESLLLEAKQIRGKLLGKEHPEYLNSCSNLAVLYTRMHQYEKAEPINVEARQSIEKVLGKNHPNYAQSCSGLGILYIQMGQYEKAEPFLLEARERREKVLGKEHPDYAESCNSLGFLYWIMDNYERAGAYYAETFNLQHDQIRKIFQFTSEDEKQSFMEKSKPDYSRFLSFGYSDHSGNRHGFSYDVVLSNRNLILSSLQQLRNANYNSTDTSIKNKYNNWIRLRQQLSSWYTKPIAEREAHVKNLEEVTKNLEKELTRLSTDFKKLQEQSVTGWKYIQQGLKQNEAAIEFAEFEYNMGKRWTDSTYYIALIIRNDKSQPQMVPLFEKKQLDSLLTISSGLIQEDKNFINSLYASTQEKNRGQSKSVYNLIWQPLEKHLKGITKVYFAPAGLLHRISFAAIPVNGKEVLSDKYQLIQLNTTATVVELPVNFLSSSGKIILYGGVNYDTDSALLKRAIQPYATNSTASVSWSGLSDRGDRGTTWKYLQGSQEEINEIEKLGKQKKMSLTLFDNVNATEESFKSFNATSSPSVIHIATHGFFFPDPKGNKKYDMLSRFEASGKVFRQSGNPLFRSGLLFAGANNAWKGTPVEGVEDGILTAYEVSNLYLPHTKLVVLSACETGLGDIQGSEGVYGLQRSFKMAGVQNLVMSLWKVPDEATSEFMKQFYQNMFNRQSISDAFYKAQATMKIKYRSNPYNWAAWVLVR